MLDSQTNHFRGTASILNDMNVIIKNFPIKHFSNGKNMCCECWMQIEDERDDFKENKRGMRLSSEFELPQLPCFSHEPENQLK